MVGVEPRATEDPPPSSYRVGEAVAAGRQEPFDSFATPASDRYHALRGGITRRTRGVGCG